MEQLPVSERLPRLYRSVLDAVADLEARGRRQDAASIRFEATTVYSRAWTLDAERRLAMLVTRAARIVAGQRSLRGPIPVEPRSRQVDMERTTV